MFLVGDGPHAIEQKIRRFFVADPSVGLVLSAVYFEWTTCRAIMCLSKTPNVELRARLEKVHGLKAYKDAWAKEVNAGVRLPQVVERWQELQRAFDARNVLVHGRNRYTRNMAVPHVEVLLAATNDIWRYCEEAGFDLSKRLPVRRRPRSAAA